MVLNNRVQLFNDNQLVYLCSKVQNQLLRQRVNHAQLKYGCLVTKYFLRILIAGAGGDDTNGGICHFHPVKFTVLCKSNQVTGTLLHQRMTTLCVARHHNILGNVLFIGLYRRCDALARLHNALGMCHTGAHFQDNRGIKLFRQFKGTHGKFPCFRGIRRLQHRNLGCDGMMAGILLILRGMHAGIIRYHNHHTCIDTGIGNGKQRVCCHIESYMLHAAEAALACQRRTKSHFHGYLFIGCPLTVHFLIFCGFLCYLGTRGARITGNHAASGFI